MAEEESPAGYVLRGSDGSLYLIRDEILESCKMQGEDLEFAREQGEAKEEDAEVEVFDFQAGSPFFSMTRVDYTNAPRWQGGHVPSVESSTTMCGW